MTEIRNIVKQVLSQLGASREARYYLTQYAEDELNFAVIKIGGALIENQLEPLADSLAFLHNLGLMPIVLHGAGPQLDAALLAANVPTVKHNGLRVTTPEVMEVARPVVYRTNDCLISSQVIVRRDEAYVQPCTIGNTATFVEQGMYVFGEKQFNIAAAQYPGHDMATQAVRDIFKFARTAGTTGNFSVGPIAYDYVYSFADDIYTLTWSHEEWVFSISTDNSIDLDNLLKVFPY